MKAGFNRPFTKREKAYLGVLAVLLLVAAYIYLVYLPVERRTAAATKQIEQVSLALAEEQTVGQQLVRMRDALDALKAEGRETETLPGFDNGEALVAELDGILSAAASYDVVFQPVIVEPGLIRRHLQINFTCADYERAAAVLAGLDASAYRNQISTVNLNPAESRLGGDLMQGGVQASVSVTYFEYNG